MTNIQRPQAGRLPQASQGDATPPPSPRSRVGVQSPLQQDAWSERRRESASGPMAPRASLPSPGSPSYSSPLNSPMLDPATAPDEQTVSRMMQDLSGLMGAGQPSSVASSSGGGRAQAGPSRSAGPSAVRGASPADSASEARTSSDASISNASSAAEEPANTLEALGYKKKQIKKVKAEAWSEIVKHHAVLVGHGFTHDEYPAE